MDDRQKTDRPSAMFSSSEKAKIAGLGPLAALISFSNPLARKRLRMRLAVGAGMCDCVTKCDALKIG
jgi:hypothetical protein